MFLLIKSTLPRLLPSGGRVCRFSAARMAGVYVRCIPNEEKMQISVVYAHNGQTDRTYNLERLKTEGIGRAINRLQQNILKSVSKKKKKKLKSEETDSNEEVTIPINLFIDGAKLEEVTNNSDGWVQGAQLDICGTKLEVDVNLPTINGLSLPSSMMAGFPIFPKIDMEFADISDCSFKWYRATLKFAEGAGGNSSQSKAKNKNKHKVETQLDLNEISEVSQSIIYTPSNTDIGFFLKVECIPKHGRRVGRQMDCISKVEVSAGPGLCPFENRQLYTQKETETGRVVSYNILADMYADSEFSRNELYPYCPPYALSLDYRKQLLLKEITGYNADIVCLQECDKKVFEGDLLSAMDVVGLDGWLKVKGGQIPEGSATFYRRSKFKMISQHDTVLTDFLKTDPVNRDLWERICRKDALKEKMEARSTALQVTVLQSTHDSDSFLCVANTHLFFHPKADNVRAIQIALSVRFLQQVCHTYREKGEKISIVFCGDFNSSVKRAVNVFMTTGYIPADFDDWASGGEEEKIGYEFSHDFKIKSACGYVDYTNYTGGFHGLLDYIFMDTEHLEVEQVIPMPKHEEVVQHFALPSVVFPSDHIAQIVDIKWKTES